MYFDSLVIGVIETQDFQKWCDWANRMARKIAEISQKGLLGFTKGVQLGVERQKAVDSFTWLD